MAAAVTDLPAGTVTYFFSDVQDSTGLLQRLGSGYKEVIERHAEIIRSALSTHDGVEVSTEGDSFFAVFRSSRAALAASCAVQLSLAAEPWPAGGTVTVRIGLHTGTAELGADNYVGIDVNRAARISAAGHGGQIVLSDSARDVSADWDFTDLGEHALRGLERREHLYQLDIDGLPQSFPPLRTQTSRPNNLPALTSQIVGRSIELASIQEMIALNRLTTITGPGGIGKTRLALEVASKVSALFDHGVFLVDLAPVTDADLVLPTIAAAIGASTDAGGLDQLLNDGDRLLLLDNFEQVSGAAPRIGELLSTTAPLKLLVTSQVPLKLESEKVYKLQPLVTADEDSAASELFATRARQIDPSFNVNRHISDVVELVEALDGVPLAIELAAARVNVLTPGEINARLNRGVLKSTRTDAPERHKSIEAAVEWSFGLLNQQQQNTLEAISVFRGGATLAGVEAVLGADPLDDLAELVDHSLVEAETGKVGKRFDLLAPIKLFAADRVSDAEDLAASHAAYFFNMCGEARQPLEGDGRAHWLAVLDDEHDNLSAALGHFLAAGRTDEGFEMVGLIWRFFHSTGRLGELELWLRRFFEADASDQATASTARALVARAALHYWRNEWKECIADYETAVAIAESLDLKPLLAEALVGLSLTYGIAESHGLRIGAPSESALRARQIYEEIGDPVGLGNIDFNSVFERTLTAHEPKPPSAASLVDLLDRYPEGGTLLAVRIKLTLSETYIFEGDYENARLVTLDALRLAEDAGDIFYLGMVMRWLGVIAVECGIPEVGASLAGSGAAAVEEAGGSFPPSIVPIESAVDRARGLIGDEANDAYERGREVSLIDAITQAREHLENAR